MKIEELQEYIEGSESKRLQRMEIIRELEAEIKRLKREGGLLEREGERLEREGERLEIKAIWSRWLRFVRNLLK